jgi:hypothetical protein
VFVMQANGDAQRTEEQPYGIPDKKVPERWDVVGLGQAMVVTAVTLYCLVSWFLGVSSVRVSKHVDV